MKELVETFLSLPMWQGVCIIVATVVLVLLVGMAIAFVAYLRGIRVGERLAVARHNHFTTKRRELASIRL
jgi:hypothetical protein